MRPNHIRQSAKHLMRAIKVFWLCDIVDPKQLWFIRFQEKIIEKLNESMKLVDAQKVRRLGSNVVIQTMASGELPTEFKFFLYAQDTVSGCTFLIQSNVDKSSPYDVLMIVTVKVVDAGGSSQALVDQLVERMGAALRS